MVAAKLVSAQVTTPVVLSPSRNACACFLTVSGLSLNFFAASSGSVSSVMSSTLGARTQWIPIHASSLPIALLMAIVFDRVCPAPRVS